MRRCLRVGIAALLGSIGCSGPPNQAVDPVDPEVTNVMQAHWAALQHGEWRTAYERLHPDVKKAGLTLKRFTDLHARRLKSKTLPHDIKIAGLQHKGDDVVVSFDVLIAPQGVGEPVAVPPRRRVILRKTANTWRLMTHDLLAVRQ
jgi:hypothetical protein